jgi:CHAT domain-containing protein
VPAELPSPLAADLLPNVVAARHALRDADTDVGHRDGAGTILLAFAALTWEESSGHAAERVSEICDETLGATSLTWGFRPAAQSLLSLSLRRRYEDHGNPALLRRATTLAEECFQAEPDDSSDKVELALHLATLIGYSWDLTHSPDIDCRELDLSSWAVSKAAPGSAALARARNNLARAQARRFERHGASDALDTAIATLELGVEEAPTDWPERGAALSGLGHWTLRRFNLTGQLVDLERSVAVTREAMAYIRQDLPERRLAMTNLASALNARGHRNNTPADLAEAEILNRAALSLVAPDAPDRAGYLNNVATTTGRRSSHDDDPVALDRAIALLHEASIADPDFDGGLLLINHARNLLRRYMLRGDPEDLMSALAQAAAAVDIAPADSPRRFNALAVLARAQSLAHKTDSGTFSVGAVSETFKAACAATGSMIPDVLALAFDWCAFAHDNAAGAIAAEAAEFGLAAMLRLVRSQVRRSHSEEWLAVAAGYTHIAARAFLLAGRLQDAVAALETGRAITLGETLRRDRADLRELRSAGHDDLADAFVMATDRLRTALESADATAEIGHPTVVEARASAEVVDAAITAIRRVPGFSTFSEPGTLAVIAEATLSGPLVYLSPGPHAGLALAVARTDAIDGPDIRYSVWTLPSASAAAVQRCFTAWMQAYERRGVDRAAWVAATEHLCDWAGEACMGSIITELGFPEHITIVAGGLMGALPLHAATWTGGSNAHCVIDTTAVTLSPSAEVSVAARRTAGASTSTKRLVVEVGDGTSGARLAGALDEANLISFLWPGVTVLRGRDASHELIALEATGAGAVHFCGHAMSFPVDPHRSHLDLGDGTTLSADAFSRLDLRRCQLVVLSACETGMIGTAVPDEAISLASAAFQAGAGGVVASLWAADDLATAILTAHMYQSLAADRPPAAALRDSQLWLRDTTCQEQLRFVSGMRKKDGSPSLPSVEDRLRLAANEGRGAQRSFADAISWATFAYHG